MQILLEFIKTAIKTFGIFWFSGWECKIKILLRYGAFVIRGWIFLPPKSKVEAQQGSFN